jgi:fatty acid desaturase
MTTGKRYSGMGILIFLMTLIATLSLTPSIVGAGSSWLEKNSVAFNAILLVVFALGFVAMVAFMIYQRFFNRPSEGGVPTHQASAIAFAVGMLLLGGGTAADVFGVVLPQGQILSVVGVGLLIVGNLIFLRTLRRS